jgi:hypothetical protein
LSSLPLALLKTSHMLQLFLKPRVVVRSPFSLKADKSHLDLAPTRIVNKLGLDFAQTQWSYKDPQLLDIFCNANFE